MSSKSKQAQYKNKRFKALYPMLMGLQNAMAGARTPEERQQILEHINEVMALMDESKHTSKQ